jgi:hypothetical protein
MITKWLWLKPLKQVKVVLIFPVMEIPSEPIDLDNDELPAAPALSPPLKKTRKVNFEADGGVEEVDDDSMEELAAPSLFTPPTTSPGQPTANQGTLDPAVVQLLAGMLQKTENTLVGKMDQMQASQQTVLETVDAHTAQIASIEARLQLIETKQSQQTPQDVPPYVSQLQHEVKELTGQMHQLSRARAPSAPPHSQHGANPAEPPRGHRAASAPPLHSRALSQPSSSDVDWNHLVIGGWLTDTRRETVEAETKALVQAMGIQTDVLEVIVYGRRASTSHVRLRALPDSEAKRRLLQLKADNLDKHTVHSSGKIAWLTQHKSAHKRFNNRATKYVKDTLQTLVSPSSVDQFDVDWNRQILWLQDARVAASQAAALLAPSTDQLETLIYSDSRSQDTITFHVNLTRISTATQIPVPALKQALGNIQDE